MKKYQVYGFHFIPSNKDRQVNIITETKEPSYYEFPVICFDGVAFFSVNRKFYVARYKKINQLSSHDKDAIKRYCGYCPTKGEYGVIMGALGYTIECDYPTYYLYYLNYSPSIKKKDLPLIMNIPYK